MWRPWDAVQVFAARGLSPMTSAYPAAGTYGVTSLSGFVNGAIRIATRSHWSHAFINLGDGRVVEAEPSGARIAHLDEYEGLDVLISEQPPDPQWVCTSALALVGTKYGVRDIIALGVLSLGIRPKWLIHWASDSKSLICSQLVSVVGPKDWQCGQPEPGCVTPGDLADRHSTSWWRWP